jgi:hypothetical protein
MSDQEQKDLNQVLLKCDFYKRKDIYETIIADHNLNAAFTLYPRFYHDLVMTGVQENIDVLPFIEKYGKYMNSREGSKLPPLVGGNQYIKPDFIVLYEEPSELRRIILYILNRGIFYPWIFDILSGTIANKGGSSSQVYDFAESLATSIKKKKTTPHMLKSILGKMEQNGNFNVPYFCVNIVDAYYRQYNEEYNDKDKRVKLPEIINHYLLKFEETRALPSDVETFLRHAIWESTASTFKSFIKENSEEDFKLPETSDVFLNIKHKDNPDYDDIIDNLDMEKSFNLHPTFYFSLMLYGMERNLNIIPFSDKLMEYMKIQSQRTGKDIADPESWGYMYFTEQDLGKFGNYFLKREQLIPDWFYEVLHSICERGYYGEVNYFAKSFTNAMIDQGLSDYYITRTLNKVKNKVINMDHFLGEVLEQIEHFHNEMGNDDRLALPKVLEPFLMQSGFKDWVNLNRGEGTVHNIVFEEYKDWDDQYENPETYQSVLDHDTDVINSLPPLNYRSLLVTIIREDENAAPLIDYVPKYQKITGFNPLVNYSNSGVAEYIDEGAIRSVCNFLIYKGLPISGWIIDLLFDPKVGESSEISHIISNIAYNIVYPELMDDGVKPMSNYNLANFLKNISNREHDGYTAWVFNMANDITHLQKQSGKQRRDKDGNKYYWLPKVLEQFLTQKEIEKLTNSVNHKQELSYNLVFESKDYSELRFTKDITRDEIENIFDEIISDGNLESAYTLIPRYYQLLIMYGIQNKLDVTEFIKNWSEYYQKYYDNNKDNQFKASLRRNPWQDSMEELKETFAYMLGRQQPVPLWIYKMIGYFDKSSTTYGTYEAIANSIVLLIKNKKMSKYLLKTIFDSWQKVGMEVKHLACYIASIMGKDFQEWKNFKNTNTLVLPDIIEPYLYDNDGKLMRHLPRVVQDAELVFEALDAWTRMKQEIENIIDNSDLETAFKLDVHQYYNLINRGINENLNVIPFIEKYPEFLKHLKDKFSDIPNFGLDNPFLRQGNHEIRKVCDYLIKRQQPIYKWIIKILLRNDFESELEDVLRDIASGIASNRKGKITNHALNLFLRSTKETNDPRHAYIARKLAKNILHWTYYDTQKAVLPKLFKEFLSDEDIRVLTKNEPNMGGYSGDKNKPDIVFEAVNLDYIFSSIRGVDKDHVEKILSQGLNADCSSAYFFKAISVGIDEGEDVTQMIVGFPKWLEEQKQKGNTNINDKALRYVSADTIKMAKYMLSKNLPVPSWLVINLLTHDDQRTSKSLEIREYFLNIIAQMVVARYVSKTSYNLKPISDYLLKNLLVTMKNAGLDLEIRLLANYIVEWKQKDKAGNRLTIPKVFKDFLVEEPNQYDLKFESFKQYMTENHEEELPTEITVGNADKVYALLDKIIETNDVELALKLSPRLYIKLIVYGVTNEENVIDFILNFEKSSVVNERSTMFDDEDLADIIFYLLKRKVPPPFWCFYLIQGQDQMDYVNKYIARQYIEGKLSTYLITNIVKSLSEDRTGQVHNLAAEILERQGNLKISFKLPKVFKEYIDPEDFKNLTWATNVQGEVHFESFKQYMLKEEEDQEKLKQLTWGKSPKPLNAKLLKGIGEISNGLHSTMNPYDIFQYIYNKDGDIDILDELSQSQVFEVAELGKDEDFNITQEVIKKLDDRWKILYGSGWGSLPDHNKSFDLIRMYLKRNLPVPKVLTLAVCESYLIRSLARVLAQGIFSNKISQYVVESVLRNDKNIHKTNTNLYMKHTLADGIAREIIKLKGGWHKDSVKDIPEFLFNYMNHRDKEVWNDELSDSSDDVENHLNGGGEVLEALNYDEKMEREEQEKDAEQKYYDKMDKIFEDGDIERFEELTDENKRNFLMRWMDKGYNIVPFLKKGFFIPSYTFILPKFCADLIKRNIPLYRWMIEDTIDSGSQWGLAQKIVEDVLVKGKSISNYVWKSICDKQFDNQWNNDKHISMAMFIITSIYQYNKNYNGMRSWREAKLEIPQELFKYLKPDEQQEIESFIQKDKKGESLNFRNFFDNKNRTYQDIDQI